jgi:hypothetical protein
LAQARPPVWLILRSRFPTCDVRGRGPGDLAAGACNEQRSDPTEIAPREVQEHLRTIAAVLAFALSHLVFVPLPLWTVLTAVILTQVTFGRSVKATLDYLPGTVGGARRLTFIGLRAGRRQVPVRRPQMSCEKRNPSAKLEYDNPFNVGMTGVSASPRATTNESQQLDVSTMALTLSFNAAKRVCNRVCGRARLEIQSAFESRRRFTPALIVLPAVCDALFQHFAR